MYPLFALLFGYGMTQLFLRQTAAGSSERSAAALLRRRSLWLIVFGFGHAALLMAGDILGAYGLAGLILGWLFLRRSDRAVLVAASVATALLFVLLALTVLEFMAQPGAPETVPSTAAYASGETDPLAAAATRLTTWLLAVTLMGGLLGFSMHAAMLLGFWAARHRILEEPGNHLPLLRRTAVAGIAIGWLGGQPAALAHIGALDVPPALVSGEGVFLMVQTITGLPAGLGYAALITLVAHRMSERARRSAPVVAVAAVGKRSLSCYLAHSVLFSPALAAWGLGLGAAMGSAGMALFATGVWLLTVLGAYALERAGRRGPAETLLHRLVYRRAGTAGRPG